MLDRAIKTALFLYVGVVSSVLLHCVGNTSLAGGVETTNGLTVVASGPTVRGSAPIGSMVSLCADTFNPVADFSRAFFDSTSTDSTGAFSFKPLGDGLYNVIAINARTRQGALASSLYVRSGGYDSIVIPFDTLGEISGRALKDNLGVIVPLGLHDVYCEGTNFFTRSDSAGFYKMNTIALGKYRVILPIQASTIVGDKEITIEQAAELNNQNTAVILNFIVK